MHLYVETRRRCVMAVDVSASHTALLATGVLGHMPKWGPGTDEPLSASQAEKPPPHLPQLLRAAEEGDGWGVPAHWEPA